MLRLLSGAERKNYWRGPSLSSLYVLASKTTPPNNRPGVFQGPLGTIRAQLGLRLVLHKMNASVVGQPEFVLPHAHQHLTGDDGLPAGSPAWAILENVVEQLAGLVRYQRVFTSAG
ncbi:hypothetical protein ACFQ0G_03450 [Streptomyces chiangmaiensis]